MLESLRDSAISSYNEALELMQKGQNKEALKALEKAEEAAGQAKEIDIFLYVQTLKGHLMQALLIWGVLKRLNKGMKTHSKSTPNLCNT